MQACQTRESPMLINLQLIYIPIITIILSQWML